VQKEHSTREVKFINQEMAAGVEDSMFLVHNVQSFGSKIEARITRDLMDSGANIHGCPTQVAKYFNVKLHEGKSIVITAFNGASTKTNQYGYFGKLLGEVPVSNDFEEFIVATPLLHEKNVRITSAKESALITDLAGKVIAVAPTDRFTKFHYVNLVDILHYEDNQQILSARIINKSIQDKIFNLHRRMGHAAMDKMIAALKSGEWQEEGISEKDIASMYRHENCVLCSLTKWNSIPTNIESHVLPHRPGSSVCRRNPENLSTGKRWFKACDCSRRWSDRMDSRLCTPRSYSGKFCQTYQRTEFTICK